MQMKEVRFFEAHCEACHESFALPLLSDFAYGELILQLEDGSGWAWLNAVEEKSFDLVAGLFTELQGDAADAPGTSAQINRLQWIAAQCADEVRGQKLTNQFHCPGCHSSAIHYGSAVVVGDGEIPVASFEGFNDLPESARKDKVRSLYQLSAARF